MTVNTSDLLKQKREKILTEWIKRALAEITSATTAEHLALRNSLPIYLDHLAEALSSNRRMDINSVTTHEAEAIRIGKLHGADRAETPSYALGEVISEYHILREVIFEQLEEHAPLNSSHRDIIISSIEQAVKNAAVEFSFVHADIQQKFITTLTHDLKIPLTGAKLSAQLILKRSGKPDDCLRSASRIIGAVNRLDSMIHDLLDASRLRAGEALTLTFEECDLSGLVRDVTDETNELHGGRVQLDAQDCVIGTLNRDGIRRALENVVGNALKYSTPSTPISVTLRRDKDTATISVHNEGPPIPKHELPLLFQQYRRAKSAIESEKTGWGLGLTLVKGVIEAHKGKVHVYSEQNRGTTFSLEVPLR